MMKKILIAACALALLGGQAAAQNYTTPPAEAVETLESGIVKYSNLRYGPIPGEPIPDETNDRLLDLYLPTDAAAGKPLPVFVFVHGGGFRGGSKGDGSAKLVEEMAKRGFAAITINYRLRLKYNNPSRSSCGGYMKYPLPAPKAWSDDLNAAIRDAVNDANQALGWVKSNAKKYNFDTKAVFVGGGSAGAITVLHLAYDTKKTALPITGVLDLWGALEDASVIKKGAAPVLIYHGDKDALVHYQYGLAIKDRMEKIGQTRSVTNIMEGKGHAQYKYIISDKMDEIADFFRAQMK